MFGRRQILLTYAIAVALALGIFVHQLWSGYQQQVQEARSTATNLARVLEQRLDASLRRADATLEELVGAVRPETLRAELRARFAPAIDRSLAAQRVRFGEVSAFRIIAAGMDDFLAKPIAFAEVTAVIVRHLGHQP